MYLNIRPVKPEETHSCMWNDKANRLCGRSERRKKHTRDTSRRATVKIFWSTLKLDIRLRLPAERRFRNREKNVVKNTKKIPKAVFLHMQSQKPKFVRVLVTCLMSIATVYQTIKAKQTYSIPISVVFSQKNRLKLYRRQRNKMLASF